MDDIRYVYVYHCNTHGKKYYVNYGSEDEPTECKEINCTDFKPESSFLLRVCCNSLQDILQSSTLVDVINRNNKLLKKSKTG